MSLLALIVALVALHVRPAGERAQLMALYGRLCVSTSKRLNAGDRNSGAFAWFALMAVVLVPVALVTAFAAALHPVFVWLLDVAFLYFTLRLPATIDRLAAIETALREGDAAGASIRLAQWRGEPFESEDPGAIARLAAEYALREAHAGMFAPLLWFLVLPGPLGLVLHPLALRAARTWGQPADAEERDFGWFAARAFHFIDWVPQRATAFAFAVAGNFEDALLCWRSQAARWIHPEEGIVLASGAGALGVRLGEPVAGVGGVEDRPALGTGDAAREDSLASLEGLLWRSAAVWSIVFLLAAALQLG